MGPPPLTTTRGLGRACGGPRGPLPTTPLLWRLSVLFLPAVLTQTPGTVLRGFRGCRGKSPHWRIRIKKVSILPLLSQRTCALSVFPGHTYGLRPASNRRGASGPGLPFLPWVWLRGSFPGRRARLACHPYSLCGRPLAWELIRQLSSPPRLSPS